MTNEDLLDTMISEEYKEELLNFISEEDYYAAVSALKLQLEIDRRMNNAS